MTFSAIERLRDGLGKANPLALDQVTIWGGKIC